MTVLSSDLLLKVNLPKVNALSQSNPNTELLAAQLIVSQEKIGGLPTVFVPGIPEDVVLITNLKNLSVLPERLPASLYPRRAALQPRGDLPVQQ